MLALVVTCPLYIFYARAFLIETMALMFSLWFWVGFERAVAGRNRAWLVLAVGAGTGAGLVKVTTFLLYLLPAALWALHRLWAARREGRWRGDLAWMAGAVAVPFAATLWWLDFADAVKAQNPLGRFLVSSKLTDFTFGTTATRFSSEFWLLKARIVTQQLTWWPVLVGGAALALLAGRSRWREILLCTGAFGAVLVIFPILYAYHDYYYVANTVLLMIALGLVLVALAESARPRWLVALAVLVVTGGQAWRYLDWYYPGQSAISPGGDGLTQSLRALTRPDEVLIVTGQDWSSITPYYAQRRAAMLRDDLAQEPVRLREALDQLHGERIGALVVTGTATNWDGLIASTTALGLEPTPFYRWRDTLVFLPAARHAENIAHFEQHAYHDVRYAPGVEPLPERMAAAWFEFAKIGRVEQRLFHNFQPRPVRFFSTYGPALGASYGQSTFGAHPVTRLVFALPAGPHTLHAQVTLPFDAYRPDLAADEATDGVEIALVALGPGDTRRVISTQILDPRNRPEDRKLKSLTIAFQLEAAGEVELFFGPGPQGRPGRDWISLVGPLVID